MSHSAQERKSAGAQSCDEDEDEFRGVHDWFVLEDERMWEVVELVICS